MSYGVSAALQAAIFSELSADPTVTALSGGAVYDALPAGPVPDLYVRLGSEKVRDRSDVTGAGAMHDVSVLVVSTQAGFQSAKALAAAVSDALSGAALSLTRGHLVGLHFLRAQAQLVTDGREIALWFRAYVDDSIT